MNETIPQTNATDKPPVRQRTKKDETGSYLTWGVSSSLVEPSSSQLKLQEPGSKHHRKPNKRISNKMIYV